MLIFNTRKVYKMKYFQKMGLRFGAIVAVAFAGNVMGSISEYGVNATDYSGGDLTINDADYSDGKAVVLTSAASASNNIIIDSGIVRVGAASKVDMTDAGETASSGVLATTGNINVHAAGILEITAATPDCVRGHAEIQSGGRVKVDAGVTIPVAGDASTDVFGGLKFHSGSVLVLGPGANWQRDIVLETES